MELEPFNFFNPASDENVYRDLVVYVFTLSYDEARDFMNKAGYLWTKECHDAFLLLLNFEYDEYKRQEIKKLKPNCNWE